MTVFNLRIYTDTICPWCYIGHRTLAKAIEIYQKTYPGGSKDQFVFTFSPYYLDPTAPTVAIAWEERVIQKNGAHMVNAIRTRLQRVGRENGIVFSFQNKIGKTTDSHRLLQYALDTKGNETHKLLLERIFEWHFERDGDITSHDGLIEAAVSADLPKDEISAFLKSGDARDEVDTQASNARSAGVYSVPTIEINGKRIRVEGAGDPSEFLMAIIKAKEQEPHESQEA